jgi:hypothetical protein
MTRRPERRPRVPAPARRSDARRVRDRAPSPPAACSHVFGLTVGWTRAPAGG